MHTLRVSDMNRIVIHLVALVGHLFILFGVAHAANITAVHSARGVVVKIDGDLFTEYLTKAGQSPAMWPIIGPSGKPMTRPIPVGPEQESETNDHPHHQSMWFTHDQVNGANFWGANIDGPNGDK